MKELHLDLRDRPRVIDFLVLASAYADPKARAAAGKTVKDYQDGKKVSTETLADAARKLAYATWPARRAIQHYLTHEGSEEEWRMVTAAVRPSTAHLMKRFRAGVKVKTLDEVLNHEDVQTALRDEDEMIEIAEVRSHVREDFWNGKKGTLTVLVTDAERELAGVRKRLEALRELAAAFPPSMQDEVISKVNAYEDRIVFGGEPVPLETLDEEIAYYTDQKEISPLDSVGTV